MPAVCLSEARLEASDVGALVREAIHVAVASSGAASRASRKDAQPSGGFCRVEERAEWVRCSLPSAEGGVEPAASDSEVGCFFLWCRVRPRFWRQGCCLGGQELWVREV